MSGIAGIVSPDGAPIDGALLDRMTRALAFRGPDRRATWTESGAGFGHALLATTWQARCERQPSTIDGRWWIVADARVDDREGLIARLGHPDRSPLRQATDPELILRAFHKWREGCVEHLLGDFAFAIWDVQDRRLFAARDHFGARSFFYARPGGTFVFSNTLDCVRLHQGVSGRLNDLAVADYLLFFYNQDPSTTLYADVQRLPPAHTLSLTLGSEPRVSRYWSLTAPREIRYRRRREYVEHFTSLFETAVGDRLRTTNVGVQMTGGLDSSSVAATAKTLLAQRETSFDLRAYTIVFDRLIKDDERHYAGLVASALHIPIHYLSADDYPLFHRWNDVARRSPEPTDEPQIAMYADFERMIAAHSRVTLTGLDADTVLTERPLLHFSALARSGRIAAVAQDLWNGMHEQRRLPRLGWRTAFREKWRGSKASTESVPPWLQRTFTDRLNLQHRWREKTAPVTAPIPHRRRASLVLTSTFWTYLFESRDAGVTRIPLEHRHPFTDLRVINYLLAIPAFPWSDNKTLLRAAMRQVLPSAVLNRPKTTLSSDPTVERLRTEDTSWLDCFQSVPELDLYVDRQAIPPVSGAHARSDSSRHFRPFTLNEWMRLRTDPRPDTENLDVESNSVA